MGMERIEPGAPLLRCVQERPSFPQQQKGGKPCCDIDAGLFEVARRVPRSSSGWSGNDDRPGTRSVLLQHNVAPRLVIDRKTGSQGWH